MFSASVFSGWRQVNLSVVFNLTYKFLDAALNTIHLNTFPLYCVWALPRVVPMAALTRPFIVLLMHHVPYLLLSQTLRKSVPVYKL